MKREMRREKWENGQREEKDGNLYMMNETIDGRSKAGEREAEHDL